MKIPITCPKCGDILLNEELKIFPTPGVWKKSCTKRLGHKFSITYNINESDISTLSIHIANKTYASWDFRNRLLHVGKEGLSLKETIKSSLFIPYFEPDLLNYKKLVSKIKTYILFL
jgi:hypothetical protein